MQFLHIQVWIINTKLHLAGIINGLITVECSLRIVACLVAEPLKCIYLLWGWQPKWLIYLVLWVDTILPRPSSSAFTATNLTSYDFAMRENDQIKRQNILSDATVLSNNTTMRWLNATEVDNNIGVDFSFIENKEIVCFFPASLSLTVSCGLTIFALFTTIIR